eukprot:gene12095-2205_t
METVSSVEATPESCSSGMASNGVRAGIQLSLTPIVKGDTCSTMAPPMLPGAPRSSNGSLPPLPNVSQHLSKEALKLVPTAATADWWQPRPPGTLLRSPFAEAEADLPSSPAPQSCRSRALAPLFYGASVDRPRAGLQASRASLPQAFWQSQQSQGQPVHILGSCNTPSCHSSLPAGHSILQSGSPAREHPAAMHSDCTLSLSSRPRQKSSGSASNHEFPLTAPHSLCDLHPFGLTTRPFQLPCNPAAPSGQNSCLEFPAVSVTALSKSSSS